MADADFGLSVARLSAIGSQRTDARDPRGLLQLCYIVNVSAVHVASADVIVEQCK